jgi:hypothetical protein
MRLEAVEARGVRVGLRTILSLAVCAAAASAALAHFAIDVAGDFLLANDSYDHLRHGSRELVTGIALVAAVVLAVRGLRACCEIAANHRARLLRPLFGLRDAVVVFAGAAATGGALVPGMEYLDGRLDGTPVQRLQDAFGGSISLGLVVTILCAAFVTALVCGVARWLISHRDAVATIIETVLQPDAALDGGGGYDLFAQRFTPRRKHAAHTLNLSKRAPPAISFA